MLRGVVSPYRRRELDDFQQDLLDLPNAHGWRKPISPGGLLKYVTAANITLAGCRALYPATGIGTERQCSDYQEYAKLVNERPAATLRDLLATIRTARR